MATASAIMNTATTTVVTGTLGALGAVAWRVGWLVLSEDAVKTLTRDFAVAISAFRISGSYFELDDDPETTARKKEDNLS